VQITELQKIMKECGIVGAGGAGFPSYAKLSNDADTVILNCAECEPLFKLHRQLLSEYAAEILWALDEVRKTVELINKLLVGTPINEVSIKLEYEIKPIIGKYVKQHEQIYNAFYHVFTDFTNQEVNIMGRNKMLEQPEFSSNIEKIKTVFNKLEDKEIINNIEEDNDNNIKVYIGNENNIDKDVTVIKTKFKKDNEEGTIAIIGPKRMDYERVVGMLEYMKENIER
jgi:heat-inducible transcriptional repressor